MQPDAKKLTDILELTTPLIGYYDVKTTTEFEPFAQPRHCIFDSITQCFEGEYIHVSADDFKCIGAGYWMAGVESLPRDKFAHFLANKEGLKCSAQVMEQWLENQPPYTIEKGHIVVGQLKENSYDDLKSVTFYVTPDQLSFLVTACEYNNAAVNPPPVVAPFGSGCGHMAALFADFDVPKAIIGATDIAMRKYLPEHVLSFTVTKTMFEQICNLDEGSFMYKSEWRKLRKEREVPHQK